MMMLKAQIQRSAVVSRRSLVVRATSGAPPPPPGPPAEPTPVVPAAPAAAPAPVPVAARQGLQGKPVITVGDAMAFSGPAPELVNGRLAMLGFVAAFAAEFSTHKSIYAQLESAPVPVLIAVLLTIAGTFAPILFNGNLKESSGIWTPTAELKNGRSAMMGLVGWLLLEWHAGMPMSNVTWELFWAAHQ